MSDDGVGDGSSPEGVAEMDSEGPSRDGSVKTAAVSHGPIRTNTSLLTAACRNLEGLEFKRITKHEHDTFVTEKKGGRKEVYENELKPCHGANLRSAKKKEWA